MVRASEIVENESLGEWLKEQPFNSVRVLATRSALRMLPNVFSIYFKNHSVLTTKIKTDLILRTFRADFLTWVVSKSPSYDKVVFDVAVAEAASKATAAAEAAVNYTAGAAFVAHAAANALIAVSNSFTTDAISTEVAENTVHTARHAVIHAANAVDAVTGSLVYEAVYAVVRSDAEWLENNPDDIDALIEQPLWLEPSGASENFDNLQEHIKEKFDAFRKSDLAKDTSFGLITDWYAALLPEHGKPRSLFGEKKDIELATQPKEFWEGEAQEVMDRVAELVGWPEDYRKQEEALIEENRNTNIAEQTKSEKFTKAKAEKVSSNRMAVRLQLSAIVNSIAIEKEFIGEQPNEEEKQEDWLNKKKFLEEISELATNALDLLPIEPDGTQNEKDDEVASLLSQYAQGFDQGLRKNEPEVVDWVIRLGSAAGFTSLFYLAGGYMPIATPIILGMTCGDKAVNILRVLKSSLPKKKPKDKDE